MKAINSTSSDSPFWDRAIDSYTRIFGAETATQYLRDACKELGLEEGTSKCEDLKTLFLHLSEKEGITGIYGKSLMSRLQDFKRLKSLTESLPGLQSGPLSPIRVCE